MLSVLFIRLAEWQRARWMIFVYLQRFFFIIFTWESPSLAGCVVKISMIKLCLFPLFHSCFFFLLLLISCWKTRLWFLAKICSLPAHCLHAKIFMANEKSSFANRFAFTNTDQEKISCLDPFTTDYRCFD